MELTGHKGLSKGYTAVLSIKHCVTEYAILNICTCSNDHQLAWKLSDKLTSLAQGQIYVDDNHFTSALIPSHNHHKNWDAYTVN